MSIVSNPYESVQCNTICENIQEETLHSSPYAIVNFSPFQLGDTFKQKVFMFKDSDDKELNISDAQFLLMRGKRVVESLPLIVKGGKVTVKSVAPEETSNWKGVYWYRLVVKRGSKVSSYIQGELPTFSRIDEVCK